MFEVDYAVFVSRRGWGRHYVLDYGVPDEPIRAGNVPAEIWHQRLEAGVRHVLEREGARTARGHCGLAGYMPALYGVEPDGIRVSVPAGGGGGNAPAPVSPVEANGLLEAAYQRIEYPREDPPRFFGDAEIAAMTADSFASPRLTRAGAWIGNGDQNDEALLYAVFSPESRRVYVLDRSSAYPSGQPEAEYRQRDAANAAAVVAFLQGIGVSEVRFGAGSACEIPAALGGQEWIPLAIDPG